MKCLSSGVSLGSRHRLSSGMYYVKFAPPLYRGHRWSGRLPRGGMIAAGQLLA
jgi:hypothetical protein